MAGETRSDRSTNRAELVATLSLIADLGLGQPMEHILRQTLIAMRLGAVAGYPAEQCAATYYTSLLAWVGCAVDTSDLGRLFGDETEVYGGTYDHDGAGLPMAMFLAQHVGSGRSPVQRLGMISRFVVTGGQSIQQVMKSHCLAAGDLALRLELGAAVREPLLQAFERWDGRGSPNGVSGEDLQPAIRLVQLADTIEVFHRSHGTQSALDIVRQRRGSRFDPNLVDRFLAHHESILEGLDGVTTWDEVIALDPGLGGELTSDQLDTALEALGDFADLKSPSRIGHSRGVAELAAEAGRRMGLPTSEVVDLRRAAWVHDLGMIGVSSTVWDESRPWSASQQERARTHPYLTQRMLARSPALAAVGYCASLHHERLDGSGYPYGLRGDALSPAARVLAVADVYQALRQPRPHRPALSPEDAVAVLRGEVQEGRLDGTAVDAVLAGAGHRVRRRVELPGGLTRREAEIVVLLGRGLSNPQIAARLSVSRKTVSAHLEHVYTKLGISSRTQAALFAMKHGLLGDPAET